MACGHIIKQSFNQFCCQRIHSGIITILQIQFRCLLQTRDFHIKKVTFKTIIFKPMLPGSQAEGNKTQHKKTIQTVCSVVIFSVLLSLTSFGEALLSRGGGGGGHWHRLYVPSLNFEARCFAPSGGRHVAVSIYYYCTCAFLCPCRIEKPPWETEQKQTNYATDKTCQPPTPQTRNAKSHAKEKHLLTG